MEIKAAVIHHLKKQQHTSGEGSVSVHWREGLLPADDTLTSVCAQTLHLFSRKGNSTGTFGENEDLHRFPVRVKELRSGDLDFEEFSEKAVTIIMGEMEGAPLSTGGHAFIVRYEVGGEEFLLIAMLKLREGAGIDDDNLDLTPTLVIDTDKLHEAARVNLSRWDAGTVPYLTFIKGRGADEVSAYFRKALACDDYTSGRHHTKQVIEAAQTYVLQIKDLSDEDRQERWKEVRGKLHECFAKSKEEVVLAAIAVAVDDIEPEKFIDFVTTGGEAHKFQFSHGFKPDQSVYKSLKRVQGKMGTISVSFDIEDVAEKRVTFDENQNALLIHNPSDSLKAEVKANATPGA